MGLVALCCLFYIAAIITTVEPREQQNKEVLMDVIREIKYIVLVRKLLRLRSYYYPFHRCEVEL